MRKKENWYEIHEKSCEDSESRNTIDKIYNQVTEYYNDKISDEDFSIEKERIYLKNELDRDKNGTLNFWLGIFTSLLISMIVQLVGRVLPDVSTIYVIVQYFIIFISICLMIFFRSKGDIIKSKNEEMYYLVCLSVLDDIEKNNK